MRKIGPLLLVGLSIWCAATAPAYGQKTIPRSKPVRAITIYATLPIAKFIRFPIDSFGIKAYYESVVTVKRPARFLAKLEKTVAQAQAEPSSTFGYGQVRALWAITYQDGSSQNILLDASQSLLYKHSVYYLSDILIQGILPNKSLK